jgi:hypothetical protein
MYMQFRNHAVLPHFSRGSPAPEAFGAFLQRNRLLPLRRFDCCANGSLNLGVFRTHSREKYSATPMQFGKPAAPSRWFDQCRMASDGTKWLRPEHKFEFELFQA